MTITEKDIPAEHMEKDIPVAADVTVAAVPQSLPLRGAMWEKQYEHITEAPLTMASSLTLLMIAASRWSLSAERG